MTIPAVKICCISTVNEAKLAISYGASAIGLVSKMPSGPGVIPDEKIIEIVEIVTDDIDTFLLTSETGSQEIITQHRRFKIKTLQLVDEVAISVYKEIRNELPMIKLVQVVHVTDDSSVIYAGIISKYVDAILLDSGNPGLKIKELGGTGRIHDWSVSRRIREKVEVPVYLAGGLNPENVRDAVNAVEPFGVDLCSGVRTGGRLDESKLKRFFEAVNTISE